MDCPFETVPESVASAFEELVLDNPAKVRRKEGNCLPRYIIEFGLGLDFHGQDVTKAAAKAVRDAISKSCLCGLSEILHLDDLSQGIAVHVTVAVSRPQEVDLQKVAEELPVGAITITPVTGGLNVPGLYLQRFGDKDDSIEAALACVEVTIAENAA